MLPFFISLPLPLGRRVTGPPAAGAGAGGGLVAVDAVVDGALPAGGDLVRVHLLARRLLPTSRPRSRCLSTSSGMVVVGLGFREGDAKATRREKEKMDLMMEDGRREEC